MSLLLLFNQPTVAPPVLVTSAKPQRDVTLDPQRRGDPFDYSSALTGGYTSAMIDEMWFTLRKRIPPSATTSDGDAVAQGKLSTGDITFSDDTNFRVFLVDTQSWPAEKLYWDCQVRVAGLPYTVASGTVPIIPDITRAR